VCKKDLGGGILPGFDKNLREEGGTAMRNSSTSNGDGSMVEYEHLEAWVRLKVQGFVQELLEEEVEALLGRAKSERRKGVDAPMGWRNGYGKLRRLSLMAGTIEVRRPRVRGLEERFESRVLPLFSRRTREVGELLPELYLHGLATGDFELALRGLLGDGAPLSAASIQRLKAKWEAEYEAWSREELRGLEPVYLWTDGIYVKAGIGKDKAALLVVLAAMSDGTKRVVAVEPGYRESTQSWAGVLRSLNRRGLCVPRLVIADGHLGIWAALAEIYPQAGEQRCWNHKITNVLDALPKRIRHEAGEHLKKIPYAATRGECERFRDEFVRRYRQWYPQAVEKLMSDWDRMVAFYEFPEQHWKHIRTSNVVESPFSAIRVRTDAARRYKNVANATALIWKVLMVSQKRFRKLNAPHLLAEVYAGVQYRDGQRVREMGLARRAA
jgi:putative transposase